MERFNSKRGQTEIIGLMVIVILLIFLGVTYLSFVSFKEKSILPTLRTNIEADNALKAVMKVGIEEVGWKTVEEMVVGCNGDVGECEVLEDGLNEVFGEILTPREEFSFAFYADDVKIVEFGSCGLGVVASYSFIKDYVFYETKLKLCKN